MSTTKTVRLSHPDSENIIEVNADHAALYRGQGWRDATPQAPGPRATKADWVAFGITQGFDADEAEAMTKAELIAALA